MQYPKITVITPVFNQAEFIERTIRSILDQEYPNLEYIIVDGGSTDGTLEIIKKYESKITRIISGPDEGMYYALQKGFDSSTGDIMAWLNSDDLYHNKSLFIAAEIFNSFPEIEFLMGQATTFDEKDRCLHIAPLRNWSKYDYYLSKNNWVIQQESTFWRRSLWTQTGAFINTKYKLAADCELWTRFLTSGAKLYMANVLIGGFRVRENQLSANKQKYHEEVRDIYANLKISKPDQKRLKEIKFYKKYLIKVPILRFVFPWNKKYKLLFDYPGLIKYDFQKKKFIMSRL